jgi:hypothetical protein
MKEKHFPGEKHTENVYEKNIEGKQVLVLVVPKDKNGYYCMGSDMEMRVIHRNISTYKPYFRYDYETDYKGKKCDYSWEGPIGRK